MNFFEMTAEQMAEDIKQSKLYNISCRMQNEFSRSGYSKEWESLNNHFQFIKNN